MGDTKVTLNTLGIKCTYSKQRLAEGELSEMRSASISVAGTCRCVFAFTCKAHSSRCLFANRLQLSWLLLVTLKMERF